MTASNVIYLQNIDQGIEVMHKLTRALIGFFLTISVSFAAFSASKQGDILVLKQGAPDVYVVKKGDTLWDISALFLDSPWLWPRLWQVNPEIENPHLIYPGDKLTLSWLNGQPLLSLKPMKKIGPHVRKSNKEAIPTLSDGLVLPYLRSDRLIDAEELQQTQHVMGTSEGRKFLSDNDRVYIDADVTHTDWAVYRPVAEYQRQDSGNKAYALRLVAKGKLIDRTEKFSGLQITTQQQEIQVNDVVLPVMGQDLTQSTVFYPTPAPAGMIAQVKGAITGLHMAARNDVVVIDKGEQDGVKQGNVFELSKGGFTVRGDKGEYYYDGTKGFFDAGSAVSLPSVTIGELVVIRTYAEFSLAVIMKSTDTINQQVLAVSPVLPTDADEQITSNTTAGVINNES